MIQTHKSKIVALLHITLVWYGAFLVVKYVLNKNFENQIYDPSADSLAIPIGMSGALFIIGACYLLVVSFFICLG